MTPAQPAPKSNTRTIIIIIAVILVLCICACLRVFVIAPAVLGPSFGNIFSNIIESMTPAP